MGFSETSAQIFTLRTKYPRTAHVSLEISLSSSSTLTHLLDIPMSHYYYYYYCRRNIF